MVGWATRSLSDHLDLVDKQSQILVKSCAYIDLLLHIWSSENQTMMKFSKKKFAFSLHNSI